MTSAKRPVHRTRLADELADRIVHLIRTGRFAMGERLPAIADLARSFGVGSPTLREALKRLESVGVVEIRHGSGVYVTGHPDVMVVPNPMYGGGVSRKGLVDLIEARIPIEVETAGLAAEHATPEQIAGMRGLLDEAGAHLDDDDLLSRVNMAFHKEIASASGNRVMAQLLEVLTTLFQDEQRAILAIHGSRERDHAEHRSIQEAIAARDGDLSRHRMRGHLEEVRDCLLAWDPESDPLT